MENDKLESKLAEIAQDLNSALVDLQCEVPGAYLELSTEGELMVKENPEVTAKVWDLRDKAVNVAERFQAIMSAFYRGGTQDRRDKVLWKKRLPNAVRLSPAD